MSYPTQDTDWAVSAKGNYWRRLDGVLLVVGTKDGENYWMRVGDDFLSGMASTLDEAMDRAEEAHKTQNREPWWG